MWNEVRVTWGELTSNSISATVEFIYDYIEGDEYYARIVNEAFYEETLTAVNWAYVNDKGYLQKQRVSWAQYENYGEEAEVAVTEP